MRFKSFSIISFILFIPLTGLTGNLNLTLKSETIPIITDVDKYGDHIRTQIPVYEYLNISLTEVIEGLDIYLSGWGNLVMGSLNGNERADADLNFGYAIWRSGEGRYTVSAGRFFLFRGATEQQVDGALVGIKLPLSIIFEIFGGKPAVSRAGGVKGDYLFGGRLSWSYRGILDLSLHYLDSFENGKPDKNNIGVDASVSPLQWFEVRGHIYYSILFGTIFDYSSFLIIKPLRELFISIEYSGLDPSSYLGGSSIFSAFSSPYSQTGLDIEYRILRWLTLNGGYKYYDYEKGYGHSIIAGSKFHSLFREGDEYGLSFERLYLNDNSYFLIRGWSAQPVISHLHFHIEVIDTIYDKYINNYNGSLDIHTGFSYEITKRLEISGALSYSKNPDFNDNVSGMVKLTCIFESERRKR